MAKGETMQVKLTHIYRNCTVEIVDGTNTYMLLSLEHKRDGGFNHGMYNNYAYDQPIEQRWVEFHQNRVGTVRDISVMDVRLLSAKKLRGENTAHVTIAALRDEISLPPMPPPKAKKLVDACHEAFKIAINEYHTDNHIKRVWDIA